MAGEAHVATAIDTHATDARGAAVSMSGVSLTKTERKQRERTRMSLAFLDRIDRINVTGTTFFDAYERVLFDVVMKKDSESARPSLSARATRRDAKKPQPLVDYSSKKALTTLKSVHQAVHEWSSKHDEAPAPDGSSQCAYCKQFNSPAALERWKWTAAPQQREPPQPANTGAAALTVVANTSVLEQYNRCLTSYLECARNVPTLEHACPGMTHIPVIVASFIANEPTTSSAISYTLAQSCALM